MIQVDLILEGEDEPFTSTVFDQAPAVGDRIWIQEKPRELARTVEVTSRLWNAMVYRPSPNNVVTLWVRDVAPDPAPAEDNPQHAEDTPA